MGRELKRVPLDFNWPFNKIWQGYINPHYKFCPDCSEHDYYGKPTRGTGTTVARRYVHELVRLLMLAGGDGYDSQFPERIKRRNFPHPWLKETPLLSDLPPPDAELTQLTDGLAERKCDGPLGYDSIATWVAERNIIKAAGLDEKTWGICPTCKGDAIDPKVKEAYEAWKPTDPPEGPGFQLWENTSEGSPQTPVFATIEELCEYASKHCTTFADNKVSAEQWRKMLDEDFVRHEQGKMIFI